MHHDQDFDILEFIYSMIYKINISYFGENTKNYIIDRLFVDGLSWEKSNGLKPQIQSLFKLCCHKLCDDNSNVEDIELTTVKTSNIGLYFYSIKNRDPDNSCTNFINIETINELAWNSLVCTYWFR